jgi:hypothetical protein
MRLRSFFGVCSAFTIACLSKFRGLTCKNYSEGFMDSFFAILLRLTTGTSDAMGVAVIGVCFDIFWFKIIK